MLECAARAQASVEPPADPIRLRIQSAVGEVDAGITKCIDSVSHIRGLSLCCFSPRTAASLPGPSCFSRRAAAASLSRLLLPRRRFSLCCFSRRAAASLSAASLPAPRLLSPGPAASLAAPQRLLTPGFSYRAAASLSRLRSPRRCSSLSCFSRRAAAPLSVASLPAPRLLSASSLPSLLLLFSRSSLLSASSLLSPGFSCRAAAYLSLLLSPGRNGSLHCFSPRRVKSSNGIVKSSNFPCSSFLQQYSSFIPNKGR